MPTVALADALADALAVMLVLVLAITLMTPTLKGWSALEASTLGRMQSSVPSLASIENWPVPTAAAAVVRADGTLAGSHGPTGQRFPLASVTKPLTAYAVLVAYEEGDRPRQ